MELFKKLKACRPERKRYRIRPAIKFCRDHQYYCSLIPTIFWIPWIYRDHGACIFEIWWLNFHIAIGKWEQLSCLKCKHQKDCIDSGKITWWYVDVFEEGKKCADYKAK